MRGVSSDQEPLDLIEIAAELVKEYGVKPWEVPELDRWWIAFVYFARRDKYGQLIVRSKQKDGPQLSTRDAWIKRAEKEWGYPTWYAHYVYDKQMMASKKVVRTKAKAKVKAK